MMTRQSNKQWFFNERVFTHAVALDWPGGVRMLDVGECARAFAFLATHAETINGTILVSAGQPIRFGDLFREMGAKTGISAVHIRALHSNLFFMKNRGGSGRWNMGGHKKLLNPLRRFLGLGIEPNDRPENQACLHSSIIFGSIAPRALPD
jgi:nucleoside-diphosphate-sugar epimerase